MYPEPLYKVGQELRFFQHTRPHVRANSRLAIGSTIKPRAIERGGLDSYWYYRHEGQWYREDELELAMVYDDTWV